MYGQQAQAFAIGALPLGRGGALMRRAKRWIPPQPAGILASHPDRRRAHDGLSDVRAGRMSRAPNCVAGASSRAASSNKRAWPLLEHRREQIPRGAQLSVRTAALPARGGGGAGPTRSARPVGSGRSRVTGRPATSSARRTPSSPRPASGTEGLFIGQDAWSGSSFCYDPWVLYRDRSADQSELPARRCCRQRQVDAREGSRHPVDRVWSQGLRAGRSEGGVDCRRSSGGRPGDRAGDLAQHPPQPSRRRPALGPASTMTSGQRP